MTFWKVEYRSYDHKLVKEISKQGVQGILWVFLTIDSKIQE